MTDWSNKEEVLEAVKEDGHALKQASEDLRADREVVLAAVRRNGMELEHASEKLRDDKEVVMKALNNDTWAFQFASEEIRNDKEVVEEAFYGWNTNEASGLAFASDELKDNKDFIIDLFSSLDSDLLCPKDLSYISEALRDDKELVLLAMKNGYCLEFASERLRGDKEVVLAAIKGFDNILAMQWWASTDRFVFDNYFPLRFASEELRANREVMLAVFTYSDYFNDVNIDIFKFVGKELKKDPEFMKEAEQYLPMTNQPETINEKDLIVRKDGLIYKKHARVPFTGIGEYLINDGYNGQLMGYNFKDGKREDLVEGFHETNKGNVYEALKFLNSLYVYAPFCEFHGLPLLPVDMYNPHPLEDCPTKLTSNKEFMLEASERVYTALDYASDELKQDKELILAALRQDPLMEESIALQIYYKNKSEELKTDNIFFDTAKDAFLEMLDGYAGDFRQHESFRVYWMGNYSITEDFAMFSNDKDVALAILAAMPSYYCFDFLEFLGPKLNEDEDFLDSIYHYTGSYIVSEYTVSEYDGSIDDFFEHYKSKEFISPRHLSRITEIIGPLELQTKSWKEQKEKDQERQTKSWKEQKEKDQERQTRIKEEIEKLKSSQGELF